MTNQVPDIDSFQTLFANLPALYSLGNELYFETGNYNWVNEYYQQYTTNAPDAEVVLQTIEKNIPAKFITLLTENTTLLKAINTISTNAPKYPAPFTGKNSPFPQLISTLSSANKKLSSITSDAILNALKDSEYVTTTPIVTSLFEFAQVIYQIEIFYHFVMSSKGNADFSSCPNFLQMLTILKLIPMLTTMAWTFFYGIGNSEYSCIVAPNSQHNFTTSSTNYFASLYKSSTDVKNTLDQISISNFSSCYAGTQTDLAVSPGYFDTLSTTDPTKYFEIKCKPIPYYYPYWAGDSDLADFDNLVGAMYDTQINYLSTCYAHEKGCPENPSTPPAPNFADMLTLFSSSIGASGARATFYALNDISHWLTDLPYLPVTIIESSAVGIRFLSWIFNNVLDTAMSNVIKNATKLPSSVQADIKTLNGYYQNITSAMGLQGSDFFKKITSLSTNLQNYTDLLATIKNNYFAAVFQNPTNLEDC